MFLNDPVDDREAQAGPLPAFFGHGDSATASSWVSFAAAYAGLAPDMTTERVLTMDDEQAESHLNRPSILKQLFLDPAKGYVKVREKST